MAEPSLSLHDVVKRGDSIWRGCESSYEREETLDWIAKGYHGAFPPMVVRIGEELGITNGGSACLLWLINDRESLDLLTRSAGFMALPFSAIWIWGKGNSLYGERQKLKNFVSWTDEKIMYGYYRSDNTRIGGLLDKLEPFEAFAGYYIVTGGAEKKAVDERMTEVWHAAGWTRQQIVDVSRSAYIEANLWAKAGTDALFQRVLQNH